VGAGSSDAEQVDSSDDEVDSSDDEVDSSDDEAPFAAANASRRRRRVDDSSDDSSDDDRASKKSKPTKSKPTPITSFAECELASQWTFVQPEDAKKIGKDLKDVNGMGDPDLAVIKLFPVQDGGSDWYLANINRDLVRKSFFWATFVDDLAEYRIPFFPKQYGKEWAFVKQKPCPSPSSPSF